MSNNYARQELINIYGISEILVPAGVLTRGYVHEHHITDENPVQSKVNNTVNKYSPANKQSLQKNYTSWDEFLASVSQCISCKLAETRTNVVPGEGSINAELMFIGEGPGADEDKTGRPFVGKAGELLTKMIAAMGYKREEVYIANVVKCRPPGNREPFNEEVESCIGYLHFQIEAVKPKVIVCLGSTAAGHLLKLGRGISSIRGTFQDYHGVKVMPTYHPAYLLRNESKKRDVWNDLKMVMAELGKL